MKRVLLHQNDSLLTEILTDLQQYKPVLNLVKQTYEKLEIGSFDNSILKEITQKGVNAIDKKYFEKCESDYKTLNVSNQTIKENLLKGINDVFNEFLGATNQLRKFKPEKYSRIQYLKPSQISFKDGIFYCTDLDKESILESECRIYLENEKEIELHDNLNKLIEAYNTVSKNLTELEFSFNYNQGQGLTAIENVFLQVKENSISIVPSAIKFASKFIENRLKYN